jgi:hypothetical protein
MKKNTVLTVIFLSFFIISYSQEFEWEAEIQEVDSNSYYDIFIRPEITSKLNYKFSDIRIFDEDNNEIPFVRRSETNANKISKKISLPFVENQHKISKKYTSVIVSNLKLEEVGNLFLIIENTNSEVWLNLSGSDDAKSWEVLKENTRYQPEVSDSLTAEINITDIPASKYQYYKILAYDFNTEVIIVANVFNYIIINKDRKFTEVMKPNFVQDDKSEVGRTILNISFAEEQYIDKISFEINNPRYFLRKAELTKKDSLTGKKIKLDYYDQKQNEFTLCSDSSNNLFLSRYKAKELFLVIDNNDDAALEISDITAFQENEYFVAYLEKDRKYYIRFGNKNVSPPIYDLKFFEDKIPEKVSDVGVKELIRLYDPKADNSKQIKIKPELLWLAFGIVVIILGVISIKVFRGAKNDQNE